YARARHLHACAKALVERHGAHFPQSQAALAALPGIGPYTAAAIAAIAFDAPAAAVDGNVERVVARLHAVAAELPAAKAEIRRLTERLVPPERAGDFAQALMDLGATICTPKKPACALCPWMGACAARRRGDPEPFPLKAPKKEGRLRRGAAPGHAQSALACAMVTPIRSAEVAAKHGRSCHGIHATPSHRRRRRGRGDDIHAHRAWRLGAERALSRPGDPDSRSELCQISSGAGGRGAARHRHALVRGTGLLRGCALRDVERHSQQSHLALG